ncbi:NAD(P)H-dependent oxidoreductase [Halobacteriovorax sp. GFR7]|uniref:NAD(P)H-dependent oxidoreductase n=1 Tax=unclassified Halobacteriovorax TaxID=2639665 RepID=UPI003D966E16
MKNILVIQGHSDPTSLTYSLAKSYLEAQEAKGNHVSFIDLSEIEFNPILEKGYKEIIPLEEVLLSAQASLKEANHIAIFYPTWWGSLPAKLKGFFDRVFLPGFAFKFEQGQSFQTKLLNGKTAIIVTTMDTPPFFYKYIQGNLGPKLLKSLILGFSGIKTKQTILVGPVRNFDDRKTRSWIDKMKYID